MKLMLVATVAAVLSLSSCTENARAKGWGGTATVDLPPNTRMVNATWKDQDLWYLVRPMREDEVAETSTLHEQSSFGVIEGKVIFKETKQ